MSSSDLIFWPGGAIDSAVRLDHVAAGSDESVRVIHLSAAGDHFCSGFDLGERAPGGDKPRVTSIHRRMQAHVVVDFLDLVLGQPEHRAAFGVLKIGIGHNGVETVVAAG